MGKKIPYFLGLLFTVFTLWVFVTSNFAVRTILERFNNIAYDLQLQARIYTHPRPALSPIAIIDIDDESLKAEGQWPWPRKKLASLVDNLQKQQVMAIVFDVIFAEKEPNIAEELITELDAQSPILSPSCTVGLKENINLFDADKIFAKSLMNANVILANTYLLKTYTQNELLSPIIRLDKSIQKQLSILIARGYIANTPTLQLAAKGEGFVTIQPDNDGIVRKASLIVEYKDNIYPSLSLQTVLSIFPNTISLVTPTYKNKMQLEGVKVGKLFIPTDAAGKLLIPFIGRAHTFSTYSAKEILHNRQPADALQGKIVLIGASALGLGDIHATAVDKYYPGAEIQATLLNGILQKNFSYIPAWTYGANFSFIIFFGLISTFLFPSLGPRILGLAIVLVPTSLLIMNNLIWTYFSFIFSFVLPSILTAVIALLNIIYGYLFETKKREHLHEIFGQYVPAKHIDEMMRSGDISSLHGEDREMTVLFADIRGFTTIAERMNATRLVKMLNDFFTPMTEIVFKHRGTIDKYVGDQLMAFWGAPLRDKHHARHALESALEMDHKIKSMKEFWESQNLPEIKIGIGVSTGILSVGDMGSRYRRNYTAQGDATNLGARLEGLTKIYGVDIIVSEATAHNQPKFVFKRLGKVRVKGKEIATEILELVCLKSDLTKDLKDEIDQFHQALDYYFQQKWSDAAPILDSLIEKYPKKKLYALFLERLMEYQQNPPPADWDGVYQHTTK